MNETRLEVANFIPDLQEALDRYAIERARLVVPGLIAKIALLSHDTTDREPGDPTLINTYLVPGKAEKADEVTEAYVFRTTNFWECTDQIDQYCNQHRLGEYKQLVVISPHMVMSDISALSVIMRAGEYRHIRSVEDTYQFISRMIAYVNFINPLFRPKLIQRLTNHRPTNALDDLVLPTGNAVQVFQETASTHKLWDIYEDEMHKSNKTTLLQRARFAKARRIEAPDNQELILIAPSATRTKLVNKKPHNQYQIGYISQRTLGMLRKFYEAGVPIIPIGISYSVPNISLKALPKTQIKLHLGDPIMLSANSDPNKFDYLIHQLIQECAEGVISKNSTVYWEPKPKNR